MSNPLSPAGAQFCSSPDLQARLVHGTLGPDDIQVECARLRAEIQRLSAYIPTSVLNQQLANPQPGGVGGAYWQGSVLFADLSGFTALSERLSALGKQGAEEITAIISRLFSALVDEIKRYGGEVLKFGGDALTAFFNSSSLGEHHAALAARAALALRDRMLDFEHTTTHVGVFRLQLRIGVHSGRVFAAQVGTTEHIELVVTGADINRVALAQEIAEAGQVVVSSATMALLRGATTIERQAGFFQLETLVEPPSPPAYADPLGTQGAGDFAELVQLDHQIMALRPYLPRQLPGRFLEFSAGGIGEFRPVSVLFANFFPLSNVLNVLGDDANTAVQVLNVYYCRAQEIVHRYGGIINKVDMYTFGDKLMALFGAPIAHENDPELATRAALELNASMPEINAAAAELLRASMGERMLGIGNDLLRQRIGINTGVCFSGLVGSQQRREYTVMGQHVNLAARLMSSAEEGSIVLSPSTQRAVERHVALRPLEPVRLKGIAEPVAIAEAVSAFGVARENSRGLQRSRLVGRDAEIEQMQEQGRLALGGKGSVFALVGEAGIGKTRIFGELLRSLVLMPGIPDFDPYTVECQSYEQNTPYSLLRQVLRQLLHLDSADSPSSAEEAQERVNELAPDMARFAPLLADMAIAPIPDTPLTAALTPEQRHDRGQELAEALLLNAARQRAIVLILDDLHWADTSSVEVLSRVVAHIGQVPLWMLLGYRTDTRTERPWERLNQNHQITLRELSPEGSHALIRELLGGPPPTALEQMLEVTAQGNPFYIEEVVRGLIESGVLLREDNVWRQVRPLDETTLPNSIEGVIIARLDRLEERSREVLQVASVVGRRFLYDVLLGILLKTDDLQERLGRLTDAELILFEEIEREFTYLFKHALTRDVAYEAILYARRRELHRTVAQQIERLYPDRLDEQLGVLARHYLLAEDWQRAMDYHWRAGKQAQSRYANREAIAFFERALKIYQTLAQRQHGAAQPDFTDPRVIEINEQLGIIYTLIGEYDTAIARFQTVLALVQAEPQASPDLLTRLYHNIARVFEKRAEFDTAFQWIERALALDPNYESNESLRVLLLGAGLHRRQGRFAQALEWGERAFERAEVLHSPRDQAHALKLLGGTYLGLGNNERAYELLAACVEQYRSLSDFAGLSDAHNDLANTCYELGRLDEARTNYEAGYDLKKAIGDVYGQAMVSNNLGGVLKLLGDTGGAIVQYQRSLAMFEQLGSLYATGVLHMNLGAAYIVSGQFSTAEEHLRNSIDLFGAAKAEDFLPELERYLAELHLRRGDIERARLACELALTTAIRLEARAEEGITRRLLGELYAQSNDMPGAWQECQHSLQLLREANSRYEIARTLLMIAQLAPAAGYFEDGQAALTEAAAMLQEIGARAVLHEAAVIAAQHHYQPLT